MLTLLPTLLSRDVGERAEIATAAALARGVQSVEAHFDWRRVGAEGEGEADVHGEGDGSYT